MPRMTISDAQLARMRAQVPLPDTAVISAMTATPDGAGGWSETWTAVTGGTVACRIDPVRSQNSGIVTVPGREGLIVNYQLTTEWGAPLAVNRRVTIDSDVYEIVALSDDHSWRVCRRALLARVD